MSEDHKAMLVRERWDYKSPVSQEGERGWHGILHLPRQKTAVYFRTQDLRNGHTGMSRLWEFSPVSYREKVDELESVLPEIFLYHEGSDDIKRYVFDERSRELISQEPALLDRAVSLATQRRADASVTLELAKESERLCSRLGLGLFL
jgi:hypothetical protein